MVTHRFRLWGGSAEVGAVDPSGLMAARDAVSRTIAEMERSCGAYRGDSDMARVNGRAGRPVRVGPTFMDVVEAAMRAASLTGGLADPLTARRAGTPDWRSIVVDRAAGRVRIPPGTVFDAGSLGPAFTADRASARAWMAAECGVMVRIGRYIAVAGPTPPDGWPVRIGDELTTGGLGQDVVLRRPGGLATAGADRLGVGGPVVVGDHHLDRWRTVTVAAGTCADASTASDAALLRGNEALLWLEARGLPSRLVAVDGWVQIAAGWPADRSERPGVKVAG